MQVIQGVEHYNIKWEGYTSDQNTWEPIHNLTNVQDMIDEFKLNRKKFVEFQHKKKKNKKRLKKTSELRKENRNKNKNKSNIKDSNKEKEKNKENEKENEVNKVRDLGKSAFK